MSRISRAALTALLVVGLSVPSRVEASKKCGGVALANRVMSVSTGKPALRSQFGKAQARVWVMIQANGPELRLAFGRLSDDLVRVFDAGLADAEHSILALNDALVNVNVSDQQGAIALVAADFFRDADGNLFPGLAVAFPTDGSSSWVVTAAKGNRGFFVEIVAARNSVSTGIKFADGSAELLVSKERILGFGKRLKNSLGGPVEGDLVEALLEGGERWIDFKAIDAGFDVDQLKRVSQAVLDDQIAEYIFAVEEGANIPSEWLTTLEAVNKDLTKAGKTPIRWGTVKGF